MASLHCCATCLFCVYSMLVVSLLWNLPVFVTVLFHCGRCQYNCRWLNSGLIPWCCGANDIVVLLYMQQWGAVDHIQPCSAVLSTGFVADDYV